ncbi:hypothetical protein CMI42_03830 [Candidatus Pacearchaeota archaeon]|nr:hypothetical protein [Candidatus Pacearchaeota archaeon]|tara:strand:+ start:143 stop:484 length:342 start_codon:yes stop_codon:yes gene_type:complete
MVEETEIRKLTAERLCDLAEERNLNVGDVFQIVHNDHYPNQDNIEVVFKIGTGSVNTMIYLQDRRGNREVEEYQYSMNNGEPLIQRLDETHALGSQQYHGYFNDLNWIVRKLR